MPTLKEAHLGWLQGMSQGERQVKLAVRGRPTVKLMLLDGAVVDGSSAQPTSVAPAHALGCRHWQTRECEVT